MKRQISVLACLVMVIAMVCSMASCELINKFIPQSEHTHNYVEGKCECGESDPDYVAPHTHNFVEGKCECGESDPDYVAPHVHAFVNGMCDCGTNSLLLGDNVFYVTQELKDYGFNFTTITVITAGEYTITPEGGIFTWIFTDDILTGDFSTNEFGVATGSSWANYGVNEAVLQPGTYWVGCYYYTAEIGGPYNLALSYAEYVDPANTVLGEGNNTISFTAAEIAADAATRTLKIETAGDYMFKGDAFVAGVTAADGSAVAKNSDLTYTLAAGEYTVSFSMFSIFQTAADTAVALKVENQSVSGGDEGDGDDTTAGPLDTENSTLAIGENTITVTEADLEAQCIQHTIVVTAAGTFSFGSNNLAIQVVTNFGPQYVGTIELAEGTYTINIITAYLSEAGEYTLTLSYVAPAVGGEGDGTEDNPIEVTLPATDLATEGDATNYLWYTFTSTEEGILTVTYSNANSWVSLYMAGDQYNSQGDYSEQTMTFEVQADSTYLLGLGVWDAEEGVTASLSFTAQALPKDGDFEKPISVNSGATVSCEYPGGNDASKFVWYKYYPWINGTLTITMDGPAIVKYGTDTDNLSTATNQQTITLDITAYNTVYIAVQSSTLAEETITFSLEALEEPGSYDNAHTAIVGDNSGSIPSNAWAVWFKYYASASGTITFTYSDMAILINYETVASGSAFEVSEGVTYMIQVCDWAEGATSVAFNLSAGEKEVVEIEGEKVMTQVIATPGNFAKSEEYTYTAAAGSYIINVTGKDASTWFQIYDAANDSWTKYTDFPASVVFEEGNVAFRLYGWDDAVAGTEVTVEFYFVASAEGGEDGDDLEVAGSFDVDLSTGFTMYTFTADASGVYTFTAPADVDLLEADGDLPGTDTITSLTLAEGESHVICVATSSWSIYSATVTYTYEYAEVEVSGGEEEETEEVVALVLGDNSVVISEKNATEGAKQCTFTATLPGVYTFASNDVGVRILDGATVVGTGVVTLEAGKTYTAAVIAMTAGTYTVSISVDVEDLPIGNTDITGTNYYEYIAETDGTLSLGISTSATSAVTVTYSVNDGEESSFSSKSTVPSASIELKAGDKVIIKVVGATNLSASFSDGEDAVVGTPIAMGNNSISQSDVVYSYTASEGGVLTLSVGGAVMGDVSISYTVNGGDATTLELNSSVDLTLVAGDKVIITVTASGYATLKASFVVSSTDEGGDENTDDGEDGGDDTTGGDVAGDVSGTYLSATHSSGRVLQVVIDTTAGTMSVIRSTLNGVLDTAYGATECVFSYSLVDGTVTYSLTSGSGCGAITFDETGAPATVAWSAAVFEGFTKQ